MKVKLLVLTMVVALAFACSAVFGEDDSDKAKTDSSAIQTVVAEGVGTTDDDALKDAFRAAVRQVVGAVVDTETLVKNDEVVKDQVLTYSNGFIKNYKPVSTKKHGGLVRTTIKATVERSEVIQKLQAAKISTQKVTTALIVEEAEDAQKRQKVKELQKELAKEQQEQAATLFAHALEKIPESVIEAKIVGDPQKGEVDGSKVSIRIMVRFSVSMQAYNAFLERLKKSLDGLSLRQGEFTMVSPSSSHDEHSLPARIDGFSGDSSDKEELLAVNTHRTQSNDRTEWSTYLLPGKTSAPLTQCSEKPLRVKLSLVDAKGGLVATDRFEGSVRGYSYPNVVYFGHGNGWQGTRCKPLAKGVWVISPYFFTTVIMDGDYVISNSYQTTLDLVREITLDIEEVKRVQDVRCELFWNAPE